MALHDNKLPITEGDGNKKNTINSRLHTAKLSNTHLKVVRMQTYYSFIMNYITIIFNNNNGYFSDVIGIAMW